MKNNKIIDESYNITEFTVDSSWDRDFELQYHAYRKKWELANKKHLFDFPLFLEVETSYACNYRCIKCPRQAINHSQHSGFMDRALLEKLFAEASFYQLPSLAFSHGGEPLMRKDLPELVAMAKDAGIIDRMFHTNASLLTKELSYELIRNGLTKINFSLDAASEETYNILRPGGNYNKVVSNILTFLEAKKDIGKSYPRVRVSFVISKENQHEKNKFFDFWKDKVNLIALQQCYDYNVQTNHPPVAIKPSRKKYFCTQLWQLLTITYDGDIIICENDYAHEYVLGNLKTHSIYECWHSEEMKKFRKMHSENKWSDLEICRNCVSSVSSTDEI